MYVHTHTHKCVCCVCVCLCADIYGDGGLVYVYRRSYDDEDAYDLKPWQQQVCRYTLPPDVCVCVLYICIYTSIRIYMYIFVCA